MEKESWRNYGGGTMEEESGRRHHGGRGQESWRSKHGGIPEASGRHLGSIWEVSGRQLGSHLGGTWEAPGKLGEPGMPNGIWKEDVAKPLCVSDVNEKNNSFV